MDLAEITAERFAPLQGDRFRVDPGDSPAFDVELISVLEADHRGPSRPQFSIVFRGGPDPPLPQRIYRIEHDDLGPLEIFLVPLGPDDIGQRYEAVFT